jgi:hypothetical protein
VVNKARNERKANTRRKRVTSLNRTFGRTPKASLAGAVRDRGQRVTKVGVAFVIAYISSVADKSGRNDTCQASDTALALGNAAMDSWSATGWITRHPPLQPLRLQDRISMTGS